MFSISSHCGWPRAARTGPRVRGHFQRRLCKLLIACLAALLNASLALAQTCPVASRDVLLFLDNSASIESGEWNSAQVAVARVAADILSSPGNRLAVVNWGCTGAPDQLDGCRIDLATNIPGGWSSNPADFTYTGFSSPANKVCRSFGNPGDFDGCGRRFSSGVSFDYAQDAFKVLDGVLFSGGSTGGNDSFGQATVGPTAPINRLILLHMTDATFWDGSDTALKEPPAVEAALGDYYYSNKFKNTRNAVVVGIGIDQTVLTATSRAQLGAIASAGGSGTDYDNAHASAASTQAFDRGTPRLTGFSSAFDSNAIASVTRAALDATTPACVAISKKSNQGVGNFSFAGGTNGLPSSLTLTTTAAANPQTSAGYNIISAAVPAAINETIPRGWSLSSAACVDSNNVAVSGVVADLSTGQLTIPAAQLTAGRKMTCTFTNTAVAADLSVVKSASAANVQSKGAVTFKLVASNAGPSDANGAALRDNLGAGLSCTTAPTCAARGGAVCPTAANLTAAALLGAGGVPIPTLPSGGAVDVTLQCVVTASGVP